MVEKGTRQLAQAIERWSSPEIHRLLSFFNPGSIVCS
jgi:hypothetical protein